MKNELMARAIGEIDDDLLEEARRPFPKKERTFATITRYAAAAACLIAVFAAVLVTMQKSADIEVSINGVAIAAGGDSQPIEIPLAAPLSPRAASGTVITLQISPEHGNVTASAGDGGSIIAQDETEHRDLTISEPTELYWVVDPSTQDGFELTLRSDDETIKLIATVNTGNNCLIVTVID